MKILAVKDDVVTIRLDSGRIVIVKEEEFLIKNGVYADNSKVGYDDAEVMGIAMKMVFKEALDELTYLRREVKYQKHPR
jgi:hypothetical protein